MIGLFGVLKSGLLRPSEVSIDNYVCMLHHRATTVILLVFSILVTSRQYIGDPIACSTFQKDTIPEKVLNQFCWTASTYTLPSAWDKLVGVEVPHHGIDKTKVGGQRIYHQYYQFVCFMLFLQALMFYAPHYLWKVLEGGRLKALLNGLKSPVLDDDDCKKRQDMLVRSFLGHFHNHNIYFAKFFFCELLNFANVIGQIYFTDRFLGSEFTTYGVQVLRFTETDQKHRTDPMVKVFPRVTKCLFHNFGSSGDVQKHDALCVLPINVINEKIYIFLWFWFILLSVITGIAVAYRFCILFFPHVRFILLNYHARILSTSQMDAIVHKSQIGDWFLLYQMSKNMDFSTFVDFLTTLGTRLMDGNKCDTIPLGITSYNKVTMENAQLV